MTRSKKANSSKISTESPYFSPVIRVHFGKDSAHFFIHEALVNDDFFATSPDYKLIQQPKLKKCQIRVVNLPHITSDAGKAMINYLYTNKYGVLHKGNALKNASNLEKCFSYNISNLFAAEICNLSGLQDLIRLEIRKLYPSLHISRSLKLINDELQSKEIVKRKKETTNSREWLFMLIMMKTNDYLVEYRTSSSGSLKSNLIKKLFLEEFGIETIKYLSDGMMNIQAELSKSIAKEKCTKKTLDKLMAEREEITQKNRNWGMFNFGWGLE